MGVPVLVWCPHCSVLLGPWDLAEDKSQTLLELAVLGRATRGPLAPGQCRRRRRLKGGGDGFVRGSVRNPRRAAQCRCASPPSERPLVPFHSVLLHLKLSQL